MDPTGSAYPCQVWTNFRWISKRLPPPPRTSTPFSMTRPKNPDGPQKKGPKPWASGSKLAFLQRHNTEWLSAHARGSEVIGPFYTQVTKMWIKKYGWHWDHREDPAVEPPDPSVDDVLQPEEEVDSEEAEKRQQYATKMREVSILP